MKYTTHLDYSILMVNHMVWDGALLLIEHNKRYSKEVNLLAPIDINQIDLK